MPSLEDALAVIDELGFTLTDPGLLASALGRPTQTMFGEDLYPDLATKVAALVQSATLNHALLDGNKRLAWVLMRLALRLNGHDLHADVKEAEDLMLAIITHDMELPDIACWIRGHRSPVRG
jgi:death-on-curing protein